MKSYFLGIVVAIGLSAVYVTNNTTDVTINFLGFQTSLNQGLWEVFLFGIGAIIMWVLSIGASIESYTAQKKRFKELNKKIEELENEKKSLLAALQNIGHPKAAIMPADEKHAEPTKEISVEKTIMEDDVSEKINAEEKPPSRAKGLFASIFKSDRKPEPKEPQHEQTRAVEQTEVSDQSEIVKQAEPSHQTETVCKIDDFEQDGNVCQIEDFYQDETDDKTEVSGQMEARVQSETYDQANIFDQTEATVHIEPFDDQAETDDEIGLSGDEAEKDNYAGENEQNDDQNGNVCELDLDLEPHGEVASEEDDSDSMEKEDREIFKF